MCSLRSHVRSGLGRNNGRTSFMVPSCIQGQDRLENILAVVAHFGRPGMLGYCISLSTCCCLTSLLTFYFSFVRCLILKNCLYVWVRDHRQHHKYSDTDADPHNANRGFFFSHVGWLMSRKHPKVLEYGKKIDMSDLEADKYIMFQKE